MGKGNYALALAHVFGLREPMKCSFLLLIERVIRKIYLTDKEKVYAYSITSVENVEPERVDVVDDAVRYSRGYFITCEDAAAPYNC